MDGLVARPVSQADPAKGTVDYIRTPMAIELEPVLDQLGDWSLRNVTSDTALENVKPDHLMWNLRPGMAPDLCLIDPGFDVDLYVEAELKALGSAWMGYTSLQSEISKDRIFLSGDPLLERTLDRWLLKAGAAEAAA